jgi:hypothetical protein
LLLRSCQDASSRPSSTEKAEGESGHILEMDLEAAAAGKLVEDGMPVEPADDVPGLAKKKAGAIEKGGKKKAPAAGKKTKGLLKGAAAAVSLAMRASRKAGGRCDNVVRVKLSV